MIMIGSYGDLGNVHLFFPLQKPYYCVIKKVHDEEEDDLYTKFIHLKKKRNVNDYTHEWEVLYNKIELVSQINDC
jgi:hypothetical protein